MTDDFKLVVKAQIYLSFYVFCLAIYLNIPFKQNVFLLK